ncbi:6-carboxytetrahydropterin synthase QueD [Candidatus Woesearchaeota archaeon]|nr:MAG: 6-carboxytetrahydropterin synthase QueD [Candidatus Woesearchaeota archaeon]
MFEVKVVSRFSAAHYLTNYKGKCESLHGHNWKVEAVVSSSHLDSRDMVIDFKELKRMLEEVLEEFDHRLINDIGFFKRRNTTSERIAQYIFRNLKRRIKSLKGIAKGLKLKEIRVWEQEASCAVYREK